MLVGFESFFLSLRGMFLLNLLYNGLPRQVVPPLKVRLFLCETKVHPALDAVDMGPSISAEDATTAILCGGRSKVWKVITTIQSNFLHPVFLLDILFTRLNL